MEHLKAILKEKGYDVELKQVGIHTYEAQGDAKYYVKNPPIRFAHMLQNYLLAERENLGPKVLFYDIKEKILIMESLEGEWLQDLVYEGNVKPRHLAELAKCCGRLHKQAIVHGDLCGDNILFCPDLKIIDWDGAGSGDPYKDIVYIALSLGLGLHFEGKLMARFLEQFNLDKTKLKAVMKNEAMKALKNATPKGRQKLKRFLESIHN